MINLVGKSIQGRRDSNQDNIYFKSQHNCFVLAVADGMGGVGGGELASKTVIDTVKRLFERFVKNPDQEKLPSYIKTIVKLSQRRLTKIAVENPTLSELGSTLVERSANNVAY